MRRLLILRPEPGASTTVAEARKRGLEAVAAPLFAIEGIKWEAPDPGSFDGLLLTSANAVRQAGERLKDYRGLQAYAVGEATAEAAREVGFGVASVGKAGVERLLGSIETELDLLHLCGEDRREPEQAKQKITAVPVYRAAQIADPNLGDLRKTVALIHSPRAGHRFAELVQDRGQVAVVAISEAAAKAAGSGWETVETAREPADDALLALAARLCNKP